MMAYGKRTLELNRIAGVILAEDYGSIRVLEKTSLKFVKMVRLSADGPELKLFAPPILWITSPNLQRIWRHLNVCFAMQDDGHQMFLIDSSHS
jgi:hypothetical protein